MKKILSAIIILLSLILIALSVGSIIIYNETAYRKTEEYLDYDSTPDYLCLPTVFDALSIEDGTSYDDVVEKIGKPQERIGSGSDYRIWKLRGKCHLVLKIQHDYKYDRDGNMCTDENGDAIHALSVISVHREFLQAEATKIIIKNIGIIFAIILLFSIFLLKFKIKNKKKLFLTTISSVLAILIISASAVYLMSPYCKTATSLFDSTPSHFLLPTTVKALSLENETPFYEAIDILGKPYSMENNNNFTWMLANGNTFTAYISNVDPMTPAEERYKNSTVSLSSETRDSLKLQLCESFINIAIILLFVILIVFATVILKKTKTRAKYNKNRKDDITANVKV